MPLIIPQDLPAYSQLGSENVFVMHRQRAATQDIRPLRILVLNLMPTKIATETQLARLLANSPLQVQLTFLRTATHAAAHVSAEHLEAFYTTFDQVKDQRFDGMIITGAPVEQMPFEQVDYWPELCRIFEFSKTNVYSTLHVCWGAQAALYYHYGIPKVPLEHKMFGIFRHRVTRPANPLVRGFGRRVLGPPLPPYRGGPPGPGRLRRGADAGRKRGGRTLSHGHRQRPPDLCHRPPGV